jgi:hypothetical protein
MCSPTPAHPFVVQRKELWRSWNAGVRVGAGLDVGVGRARLMAEVTFDRGLVDAYGGANLDEHTAAFRFAAGFLIPLGGS